MKRKNWARMWEGVLKINKRWLETINLNPNMLKFRTMDEFEGEEKGKQAENLSKIKFLLLESWKFEKKTKKSRY